MANMNSTTSTTNASGNSKIVTKKPVHFVNSISTSGNGQIVLLNSGNAATMPTSTGNQTYAIFRRPANQSIQLIAARSPIDPTNSYTVMPVIHRVRTRTLKKNLPKNLKTDELYENLKNIMRPKKSDQRSSVVTQKVFSVYKSYAAAIQSNHHTVQNTTTNCSNNNTTSINSKSNRSHKSTINNHKTPSSVSISSSASSSSSSSSSTLQKQQNGHVHGNSNGNVILSGAKKIH